MSGWDNFAAVVGTVLAAWVVGGGLLFFKRPKLAFSMALVGAAILSVFIGGLWVYLERPPLRTLGETRLWYAFWLSCVGLGLLRKWHLQWPFYYTHGMAAFFLLITLIHPESHDKTLMPALQSPWFAPHVVVYLIAYAFLTAASLAGMRGLFKQFKNEDETQIICMADDMVLLGFSFLTMGLLFGAFWAKEAWGHYWTWDPKETWAFLTWAAYLYFIHFRVLKRDSTRMAFVFLSLAWIVLLLCWFGVNYMPSANYSVHTYTK